MTKKEYIQRINAIRDKMREEIIITTAEYLHGHLKDGDTEIETKKLSIKDGPDGDSIKLTYQANGYYYFSKYSLSMLRPEVFQHNKEEMIL